MADMERCPECGTGLFRDHRGANRCPVTNQQHPCASDTPPLPEDELCQSNPPCLPADMKEHDKAIVRSLPVDIQREVLAARALRLARQAVKDARGVEQTPADQLRRAIIRAQREGISDQEIAVAIAPLYPGLRPDDLTPMTPEQIEWVRAQRSTS